MDLIRTDDFELVRSKYIEVIEKTEGIAQHARWVYGRHPTDGSLRSYIENGEMYLLADGEHVAGLVAVVMHQDEDYRSVSWGKELADDQVATLHLLAVCPDYRGRALGSRILDETEDLARRNGKKAIRLDTLASNLPAQHMYEKNGFSLRGKQHWYAENTGWIDFLLYEKVLEEGAEVRE